MQTINFPTNEIKPIEWEPYKGETVTTNIIIRKGKRIMETAYFEDRVRAIPSGNAYCIGNGPSRKGFDLTKLKQTGQTYGCNALYRDFNLTSYSALIRRSPWRCVKTKLAKKQYIMRRP